MTPKTREEQQLKLKREQADRFGEHQEARVFETDE